MASVNISNVAKSYGDTQVLFDINIDVTDGEFVVIVGPSGCGKSSLLRMVAGLEAITQGEIAIGGRIVNNVEPKDRDIAMVFQNYALYPHMNVFNNMAYGLKLRGLPKQDIVRRVSVAAKMLQLEEFLHRNPRALSGGQRQRVAMGRAIVREPAVFLFDEPLSNLDAKLRTQMRMEIRELQRRLNVTSLYVTHDQVEAMTLADRLVVLNQGSIEQIDTPQNIYEKPATVYVAGFIGSPEMNFFTGRFLNKPDNGPAVTLDSGQSVRTRVEASTHEGKTVTVGIRPEKLLLSSESDADFSCTVEAVETLGAETLVHCLLAPNSLTNTSIVVKLPGSANFNEGESLHLKIADQALHMFDSESGKRLPG
ncbi:MAG TPA: sn-glycerol-3-phosphate import ATP-binding protein UgpC [Gammaproteobacteria bacterium]|nr:sn-glycerol-3-phosphate import ATP-binding protein UgpC [Gammaproteobacteria bacterium]HIL95627.1 sn-glycerol-3-phosphate import ATP-binding protein UgpC [Pseudomonadales bacterium]